MCEAAVLAARAGAHGKELAELGAPSPRSCPQAIGHRFKQARAVVYATPNPFDTYICFMNNMVISLKIGVKQVLGIYKWQSEV